MLACIDRYLPGTQDAVRLTDIATPLTFWRSARSWRGAYEGWMPTPKTFRHVPKELPGLERFYMAGQWVEPGDGKPMAIMSGRHVAEIVCPPSIVHLPRRSKDVSRRCKHARGAEEEPSSTVTAA